MRPRPSTNNGVVSHFQFSSFEWPAPALHMLCLAQSMEANVKLTKYMEEGGSRIALAAEPGKLPKIGKGWKEIGTVEISATDGPRIGANSADIIAGVEKDGHFVLPKDSDA